MANLCHCCSIVQLNLDQITFHQNGPTLHIQPKHQRFQNVDQQMRLHQWPGLLSQDLRQWYLDSEEPTELNENMPICLMTQEGWREKKKREQGALGYLLLHPNVGDPSCSSIPPLCKIRVHLHARGCRFDRHFISCTATGGHLHMIIPNCSYILT